MGNYYRKEAFRKCPTYNSVTFAVIMSLMNDCLNMFSTKICDCCNIIFKQLFVENSFYAMEVYFFQHFYKCIWYSMNQVLS